MPAAMPNVHSPARFHLRLRLSARCAGVSAASSARLRRLRSTRLARLSLRRLACLRHESRMRASIAFARVRSADAALGLGCAVPSPVASCSTLLFAYLSLLLCNTSLSYGALFISSSALCDAASFADVISSPLSMALSCRALLTSFGALCGITLSADAPSPLRNSPLPRVALILKPRINPRSLHSSVSAPYCGSCFSDELSALSSACMRSLSSASARSGSRSFFQYRRRYICLTSGILCRPAAALIRACADSRANICVQAPAHRHVLTGLPYIKRLLAAAFDISCHRKARAACRARGTP